jgi:general secretion pathway protein A
MHKQFYGLKQDPFCLSPDPDFVYLTQQHREALSCLLYSVLSRPGLTLMIGEAGTGKTTLLYTLWKQMEKRRYCATLCVNPVLEAGEFYDFLLAKMVGKNVSPKKSQQLMALEETLLKNHAEKRPSILMIDEAHRLPSELLEEIRLLLNLETPREKLLEIILAGQQELSELMSRQELRQLRQRVSYVCRLSPLSFSELQQYVRHRLWRAGRTDATLFPENTLRVIHQYSGGIPRLINTLCDNCLHIGFALQSPRMTLDIVEEAAADLDLSQSRERVSSSGFIQSGANPFGPRMPQNHRIPNSSQDGTPGGPSAGATRDASAEVPLEHYGTDKKNTGLLSRVTNLWR